MKDNNSNSNSKFIESLTNEEIATMLRGLVITGLSVTTIEKEVLKEAADRLEMQETGVTNNDNKCEEQ